MRKLGYVLILIVCLGAGLGVGIIKRQRRNAANAGGDGLTIGDPKMPASNSLVAENSTPPIDSAAASNTGSDPAAASSPAAAVAGTPEQLDPTGGRSFGGGSNPDPVKASPSGDSGTKKHHSSGGDTMISSGDSGEPSSNASDLPPVASNTVINSGKGNEVFDDPSPTIAKSSSKATSKKGTKVASTGPAAATSGDDLNDLPVIDDPAAGAKPAGGGGATDDWGAPASTPAPAANNNPPPAPPEQVAMINNSPGDITFPSGSGAALKKISQRQNGDKSVVHIDRSGSNHYQVFKVKNPSRVYIDFEETAVPGGDPQPVGGSAHVKEISARYIKNSGGGIPKARVQILLTDDKIPNVACEDSGGGVECTIGGAAEKF